MLPTILRSPNTAPLWRQQLTALWANTTPPVKWICIIIMLGYALNYLPGLDVSAFCVTPGYLLPPFFQVWRALTFWCIELHAWEVAVDIVTVALCGKLIEPLWGRWEMVRFFLLCQASVALLSTLGYFVLYIGTRDERLLFDVHVHGLAGYVGALSVAVRQVMPDLLIFRTGLTGKFTNRNVPLSILVIGSVLWLCGLLDGTFPIMFTSGLFVAWVYLRFYQPHGSNSRGDSSDSFTFASFFPNVLQPAIGCLVEPVHRCCLRSGVIRRQTIVHQPLQHVSITTASLAGSKSGGSISSSTASLVSSGTSDNIPGLSDPQNIERRRQIALKALTERLSKSSDASRHNNPHAKAVPNTAAIAAAAAIDPRFPRLVGGGGGSDAHGRSRVPFTFEVPAIPMMAPPPKVATTTTASAVAATTTSVDLLQ